ncbi:MAG: 50S ribosomal protein L15 [Opitutae bacterium]|nr:50S ribosomal protein L15 [Opitutae bacterium]|tara:strand:+ start:375 stop:815 length:441 start_codon:yes stop_codon:yes gene_type:complete
MKLDSIPSAGNRKSKRLGSGRGNGHGKTCGRGHKGAGQRSGYGTKPGFEGGQMPLYRKLPHRGFNQTRFQREKLGWVNVGELQSFAANTKVNKETLFKAGLIRGNVDTVKVLGNGSIEKAITVEANRFSESAKEKIEAAGGKAILV